MTGRAVEPIDLREVVGHVPPSGGMRRATESGEAIARADGGRAPREIP